MTNDPLIKYSRTTVEMPLALFPPVEYFARLASYATAVIDDTARYDKRRKEVHRYDVADTRGRLSLTVPVAKPPKGLLPRPLMWRDMKISTHGDWWHTHRVTLESAYGRTPFFEFYIDRLARFMSSDTPDIFDSIADMTCRATRAVVDILGLKTTLILRSQLGEDFAETVDSAVSPGDWTERERYQVRADKLGFISGLSILDLIFNHGPESPLYLK